MKGVPRRSFLKGVMAPLLGSHEARWPATGLSREQPGEKGESLTQTHVQFVHRGELSVLFGDSSPHGVATGYCGIWSLVSDRQVHNAFVSGLAGFIFNSHRGRPVELRRVSDNQVLYRLSDPPLHSRTLFTVREPYYIDSTTTVVPRVKTNGPYLLQSWVSYINSPLDGDIFFPHEGKWIKAHSPQHGVDATYAPVSLRDVEDDMRHLTPEERTRSFHYGYSQQRFSEPFYFGRIRTTALAVFFDNLDNVRFLISPSGGGGSIIPGKTCPAWDWLWLIPSPKVGRGYRIRIRMVYKYFAGREDIHQEYVQWRKGLPDSRGGSSNGQTDPLV
jgi:hypothetical protein